MHIVTVTWKFPDPTEPFVVSKILGLVERGHVCTVVTDEVVTVADPDLRSRLGDRVSITTSLTPLRHADLVHFEHAGVARKYRHLLPGIRAPKVVTSHGSDVLVETIGQARVEQDLADVFHGRRSGALCLARTGRALSTPRSTTRPALRRSGRRRSGPLRTPSSSPSTGGIGAAPCQCRATGLGQGLRVRAPRGATCYERRACVSSYTIVGLDEGAETSMRLAIRDFGLSKTSCRSPAISRRARCATCSAASDIFVLSSVSEGSSIATVEAMAMGLPVVVTDVGGNRQIVQRWRPRVRRSATLAGGTGRRRSRRSGLMKLDGNWREGGHRCAAILTRRRSSTDSSISIRRSRGSSRIPPARPTEIGERRDRRPQCGGRPSRISSAHCALHGYDGSWEVVVVDNASTDDTAAIARSWQRPSSGHTGGGCSRATSIPYARNIGVRAAHGSRIVMCDADDVVAPGWLAALARALETSPRSAGCWSGHSSFRRTSMPGRSTIPRRVAESYRRRVLTGNLGFRREVFDRLGGFDERLPRGEDLDFGWRAIDAGYEPRSVSDAVVHYRSQWRTRAVHPPWLRRRAGGAGPVCSPSGLGHGTAAAPRGRRRGTPPRTRARSTTVWSSPSPSQVVLRRQVSVRAGSSGSLRQRGALP